MSNVIDLNEYRMAREKQAHIDELAAYLYATSSILTTHEECLESATILYETAGDCYDEEAQKASESYSDAIALVRQTNRERQKAHSQQTGLSETDQ